MSLNELLVVICILFKMDDILKLWFAAKIIVNFIALFIFYLYWKYLDNKPLGMQTVLDPMVKDFMLLNAIAFFTSSLVYIKIQDNYSHEVATTIIRINYATGGVAILLLLMATIVIRYLYIFHPGFLYQFNDHTITWTTRSFVGIGSIVSVFMENFAKEGPEYQYLTGTNNDEGDEKDFNKFNFLQGTLLTDFVLLSLLQAKIEIYERKMKKKPTINLKRGPTPAHRQSRQRKKRTKNSVFANSTLAITLVLLVVILGMVFEWTFFPRAIGSNMAAKALRTRVISNTILTVILPILWIRKIKNFSMFVYIYFYDFDPLPGPNLKTMKRVAPLPQPDSNV